MNRSVDGIAVREDSKRTAATVASHIVGGRYLISTIKPSFGEAYFETMTFEIKRSGIDFKGIACARERTKDAALIEHECQIREAVTRCKELIAKGARTCVVK